MGTAVPGACAADASQSLRLRFDNRCFNADSSGPDHPAVEATIRGRANHANAILTKSLTQTGCQLRDHAGICSGNVENQRFLPFASEHPRRPRNGERWKERRALVHGSLLVLRINLPAARCAKIDVVHRSDVDKLVDVVHGIAQVAWRAADCTTTPMRAAASLRRIVVPPVFGALKSRVLHGIFAPASVRAIELARWGHQQPGMPWELPSPESESTRSGATGTIDIVMQKKLDRVRSIEFMNNQRQCVAHGLSHPCRSLST